MATTTRRTAGLVTAMILALAASAAAAGDREPRPAPQASLRGGAPAIVLRIANNCRIRQRVLDAAQETAARIYAAIGVRLVWHAAGIAAGPAWAGAVVFRVTLATDVAEGRLLRTLPLHARERASVLGVAHADARSVYLFCHRIATLAEKSKIKALDIAFGRALAHEIGHLVLLQIVHSDTGIMRPQLDLHHDEAPGFTDEQAASIRMLLMAAK